MKTILKDKTSLHYISSEVFVSDSEMNSIVNNKELVKSIKKGIDDARKGKYKIVEKLKL
ncbi:MAG TPA: hypothetical protein PKW56_04135 [Clostridiales bacterium]|nr:hypothetical protein [Clostridiales bacterium]